MIKPMLSDIHCNKDHPPFCIIRSHTNANFLVRSLHFDARTDPSLMHTVLHVSCCDWRLRKVLRCIYVIAVFEAVLTIDFVFCGV